MLAGAVTFWVVNYDTPTEDVAVDTGRGAVAVSSRWDASENNLHSSIKGGGAQVQPTPIVHIKEVKEVETHGIDPDIVRIVCAYEWGCGVALSIVWCESRGDSLAWNPSGATGLFQIMLPLHSQRFEGRNPWNPTDNALAAYELYSEQSWWPWESSANCWR